MAGESIILDAGSDQLDLVDAANGYFLIEHAYPTPEKNPVWAGSISTEGEKLVQTQYKNREIELTIRLHGSDQSDLNDKHRAISKKVAKITSEGGVLKRTFPDNRVILFDLLEASHETTFDKRSLSTGISNVVLRFTAKPFGRGEEKALTDRIETTAPQLVFTESSLDGDVDGTARLVIDNDSAVDQKWAVWGVQSKDYSADATAALFYEAEALTPLGGAALAPGPSGASGTGANKTVAHASLKSNFQAILGLDVGGTWKTHKGSFRVFARVQRTSAAGGDLQLRAEWSLADGTRWSPNRPVTIEEGERLGDWIRVDLGTVSIPSDSERWNLRIAGSSATTSGAIYVDYIQLVPIDDGYAETSYLTLQRSSPDSLVAWDSFSSDGALAGKSAGLGGVWQTGVGSYPTWVANRKTLRALIGTDSWAVGSGRWERLGTGTRAGVTVMADTAFNYVPADSVEIRSVFARYTSNTSNIQGRLSIFPASSPKMTLSAVKFVGGTSRTLAQKQIPFTVGANYRLTLTVYEDGSGRVSVYRLPRAGASTGTLEGATSWGIDTNLATGGALASGGYGFHQQHVGPDQYILGPEFSKFKVYGSSLASSPPDAVAFPAKSLEVQSDKVKRQSKDGAVWGEVGRYVGSYLRVRPNATNRFFVSMSRGDPRSKDSDGGIDDLSARVHYTPRYLVVPDAPPPAGP